MAPHYEVLYQLDSYRVSHIVLFYFLPCVAAVSIVHATIIIIYDLYFSPLRRLPGRKSWIAFPILRYVALVKGNLDKDIRDIHATHGDIVRLGPNEVSFITAQAWQDIYGHGHRQLPKVVRWEKSSTPNILFTDDDAVHTRFRKALAYGFSDKALRLQEPLISAHVNLLIEKLKDVASSGSKTDMVRWYNLTTFDLIGDLSFGQSFEGLKSTRLHEWVTNIFSFTKFGTLVRLAYAYPRLGALILFFTPKSVLEARKKQESFAQTTVMRRINNTAQYGRGDFMDSMLRHKGDQDELTYDELVSNANILILAGSETTATLLSGATYWLLKTPAVLEKVTYEVRMQFEKEDDISFISTASKLPYMLACLDEALRIYPPVPTQFPRLTRPEGPVTISGVELPPNTIVSVHQTAAYWSPRNFHDPLSFHPERWLPSATTDPTSPFYNDKRAVRQPFHVGPRNCIGRNLAYNEMRLILARVLWNFDLELCRESEKWHDQKAYVLWGKRPLWVNLKRKQGTDQ